MKKDSVTVGGGQTLKDADFFELLREALSYAQEVGFELSSEKETKYDPNKVWVAIITRDRAAIKRVKTLTEFHPMVDEP